jgi:hypothetical protein
MYVTGYKYIENSFTYTKIVDKKKRIVHQSTGILIREGMEYELETVDNSMYQSLSLDLGNNQKILFINVYNPPEI